MNNFVEAYIHDKQTMQDLSALQKDEIYEVVNLKTWYLIFFLYSGDQTVPCVLPTEEFENHLNYRENSSQTAGGPITP